MRVQAPGRRGRILHAAEVDDACSASTASTMRAGRARHMDQCFQVQGRAVRVVREASRCSATTQAWPGAGRRRRSAPPVRWTARPLRLEATGRSLSKRLRSGRRRTAPPAVAIARPVRRLPRRRRAGPGPRRGGRPQAAQRQVGAASSRVVSSVPGDDGAQIQRRALASTRHRAVPGAWRAARTITPLRPPATLAHRQAQRAGGRVDNGRRRC